MSTSLISPQTFDPDYVVEGISTTPIVGAPNNQMWLIAPAGATGPWVGRENQIAVSYRGVSWSFIEPGTQQVAFDKTNALYYRYSGPEWLVTTDFDALGTSTAFNSSFFSQATAYNIGAPAVYPMQTGAPTGVFRFDTAAGGSDVYSITLKDSVIITDVTIYQTAAAGGAGCLVDIKGGSPVAANIFPQFTCDAANKAILRPTVSSAGIAKLAAGNLLTVATTDAGGNLPALVVLVSFARGV